MHALQGVRSLAVELRPSALDDFGLVPALERLASTFEERSGIRTVVETNLGERRLSLPAGSFAFGPKGVPHTFIAETNGAKALIGFQPFHFEGFLHEVGQPATERVLPPPLEAPPDMERLLPIAARNGMEILGPPGPPPG